MSTGLIVSIVVVVIIVVLIGWGVSAYNNLVTLKNRVKNGWAQIDVQLKQRADLIPNLVNTVKGYASHESEVFTQVTAARAGVVAAASNPSTTTAQRAAAENQLSRALFNLQATAEAYPQLQANQNFMDLQNQLKELENKIAYARQIYNDVVLKLNTAIETVPTNIIAGLFHFEQAQYFEADGCLPSGATGPVLTRSRPVRYAAGRARIALREGRHADTIHSRRNRQHCCHGGVGSYHLGDNRDFRVRRFGRPQLPHAGL